MIRLLTAATAITATAALLTVAPAQAGPPSPSCTQYAFNGEYRMLGYPTSDDRVPWTATFTSNGTVAGGPAVVAFDDGGKVQGTVADGQISGRNVHLQLRWNNGTSWYFNGVVGDDGRVRGGEQYKAMEHYPDEPMYASWNSSPPLDCIAPADPEPGNTRLTPTAPFDASDLAPAPDNVPVTKTATVTGDVDVYDAPGGSGKVTGVLRRGSTVQVLGSCNPNDWCQVSGNNVPRGSGWVWGNLQL